MTTKPGRMAGLRCLRDMPLPEAHYEIAQDLVATTASEAAGLGRRARSQIVADRRDELRPDSNLRRLLVVVGKARAAPVRPGGRLMLIPMSVPRRSRGR